MRLNFDKHFKIKMSERNFTQRFDVVMTSLLSNNGSTVLRRWQTRTQCCGHIVADTKFVSETQNVSFETF